MIKIGILIFHQVEEMDFVAPFEVLSYSNKIKEDSLQVVLIAEKLELIQAYNGMKIFPDYSFAACPNLDILIVPGGKGRLEAMHNPKIHEFILHQSKQIQYIASVCTGAFILAEMGLLDGKKATTHHSAFAELQAYHTITVEKAKVVRDGNIITSAGVTSGLELGFYILKNLFGSVFAKEVATKIEYAVDIEAL
ncbi:DJ-1/PfpI family protein [Pelosinus propionicus]|uniref:Cyclohexyl-isocyanide hydratase n=1 Tax=Pelosinus propionicus DSM 13327 TaxID=1123291 RepID=A0A1I4NKC4_9FIRM|nr:DJ-1/PfpI family protein [Pelosinus propionicus]SFM15982.1 cyclohexyl-isocyanide hydratase [Pelosinus propionicus DSM 13327]